MAEITAILALVGLAVVATLAVIGRYPNAVRRYFFTPIESGRTLLGFGIGALAIWWALSSGVAYLMLAALVGIAFGTAYVYYEEPHKEIR